MYPLATLRTKYDAGKIGGEAFMSPPVQLRPARARRIILVQIFNFSFD